MSRTAVAAPAPADPFEELFAFLDTLTVVELIDFTRVLALRYLRWTIT